MKNWQRTKKSGFTLIEVLVASGISLLLGIVLVNVFFYSRRELSHAAGTAELVRKVRIPTDRVAFYLSAARALPGEEEVLYPKQNPGDNNERGQTIVREDPSTWPRYAIISSAEDFLNPAYDPDDIMNVTEQATLLDEYRSSNQAIYNYIIWFEDANATNGLDLIPEEDKALMIGRAVPLVDSQGFTRARDEAWAAGNPFADLDPAVPARNLGRNLEDVNFFYDPARTANALLMSAESSAEVLTASGLKPKNFRTTSIIQMTSVSLGG